MKPSPPTTPPHPLVIAGVLLLLAGIAAWIWVGNWRWAATGLVALVLLAAVSTVTPRRTR